MFTKIASVAAAALVIAAVAPPAHAGFRANGPSLNSITLNGAKLNAITLNGAATAIVNFAIDGIELPVVSQ